MKKFNKIALIGTPVEVGTGNRRGCLMGPDALRCAGLVEELEAQSYEVKDFGNVDCGKTKQIEASKIIGNIKFAGEIVAWSEAIATQGYAIASQGYLPIFMGGDHSLAMGSVSAVARIAREQKRALFVLWIDAHTDYNIPSTSPSGNMHGMPVSALCGEEGLEFIYDDIEHEALKAENFYLFGIRSVDDKERDLVAGRGLNIMDMHEIDQQRVPFLIKSIIKKVKACNGMLHLSLDVDGLDPSIAPGVGTSVRGGLTYREAHMIMELLHDAAIVTSVDLAELNPFLDTNGKTAKLLVDLMGSLFGRKITHGHF